MDDADFDMINELMRQPVVVKPVKPVSEEQRKRNEVASAAAVAAWRAAFARPSSDPLRAVRAVEAGIKVADSFRPDQNAVEAASAAVRAAAHEEQRRDVEARVAARKAAQKAARAEKAAQKRAAASAKPARRR